MDKQLLADAALGLEDGFSTCKNEKGASMRLNLLARVLLMASCSLIFVAIVARTGYSAEPCMAIPMVTPVPCSVPEPVPGIITYALGFLGAGIAALSLKLGR